MDLLSQKLNARGLVRSKVMLNKPALFRLDSNNVIFAFCKAVIGDLKALLFKAEKPFTRGLSYIADDKELLIDFFLANFRLNPHNSDTLKVRYVKANTIIPVKFRPNTADKRATSSIYNYFNFCL